MFYCNNFGRVISAKKGAKTIVFDIANNFIRNHEKLIPRELEGLECFKFLRISPEEKAFLDNSRTETNDKKAEMENTLKILEVIMPYVNEAKLIKKDMTLEQLLTELIKDEEQRETALDELYLAGIEMSQFSNLNVGRILQELREKVFVFDKTSPGPIAGLTVNQLKQRGIIDLDDDSVVELMKKSNFINEEGFIVGGNLESLFAFNIYTGTQLDGEEQEEYSVDYYGCRPQKDADGKIIGYYDAAGYDARGFDINGFHRVTGQKFDERGFTKTEDGKWVNIYSGSEVDLLGYNFEGINPETGFDRSGYWHEQNPDGSFKIAKSLYATKGKYKGLNVNGFNPKGWFKGDKKCFVDYRGFYANGTTNNTNIEVFRYDDKGFDIDGFDRGGFNKEGIHISTGTKYNLEGKDAAGIIDNRLTAARDLLEYIGKRESTDIPHMSKEDVGKTIITAFSLERIYKGIPDKDPSTMKALINKIMLKNPNLLDELFELPSGIEGVTIGDIYKRQLKDLRTYNEFYRGKAEIAGKKSKERREYLLSQSRRAVPSYREPNSDFER